MICFGNDDLLMYCQPGHLSHAQWEVACILAEECVFETVLTFYAPESAADLADGGPFADVIGCGARLAMMITGNGARTSVCAAPDGTSVWVVTLDQGDDLVFILLLPASDWLPDEIRRVFANAHQQVGGDG